MKYALIRNSKVVNVIEATPAFIAQIQAQYDDVVQSDSAGPGDDYDGVNFTRPPVVPVPVFVDSEKLWNALPSATQDALLASSNNAVRRFLKWLDVFKGASSDDTRLNAVLTQLLNAGVITQDIIDDIKS